jgi:hypothetical protein
MNDENDLLDFVASEFLEGIEKKDKSMVIDALRALVLHIQDEDSEQDEKDMK